MLNKYVNFFCIIDPFFTGEEFMVSEKNHPGKVSHFMEVYLPLVSLQLDNLQKTCGNFELYHLFLVAIKKSQLFELHHLFLVAIKNFLYTG